MNTQWMIVPQLAIRVWGIWMISMMLTTQHPRIRVFAMLHDKHNQDERFTNTSMSCKNPSLGLSLPSMLCMTKAFKSMILCFSMQINVLWCHGYAYEISNQKLGETEKWEGKFFGMKITIENTIETLKKGKLPWLS